MSDAIWTKTTYQPPTEIIRGGKTLYFAMSHQEIQTEGKDKIIQALKKAGVKYRFVWNERNAETELWTFEKV